MLTISSRCVCRCRNMIRTCSSAPRHVPTSSPRGCSNIILRYITLTSRESSSSVSPRLPPSLAVSSNLRPSCNRLCDGAAAALLTASSEAHTHTPQLRVCVCYHNLNERRVCRHDTANSPLFPTDIVFTSSRKTLFALCSDSSVLRVLAKSTDEYQCCCGILREGGCFSFGCGVSETVTTTRGVFTPINRNTHTISHSDTHSCTSV